MSTYLRRSVDMPPGGVDNPGTAWDYRYWNNPYHIANTGTTWVRFWARWPTLQPDPNLMPDHPSSPAKAKFDAFDAQVNQARADGKNVIIVSYQFPRWANGTSHLAYGSPEEIDFGHQDRMSSTQYYAWEGAGRPWDTAGSYKRKDLEFRIPSSLGTDSPWARWLGFLINRYRNYGDGRVVALEMCNEPNLQMWPLMLSSSTSSRWDNGENNSDCDVATMMQTAQTVASNYGWPCYLMGPGEADTTEHHRRRVPYNMFVDDLLNLLDQLAFKAHPMFLWSHHNYEDVLWDRADNPANSLKGKSPNFTADVRRKLVNRWSGWPQDGVQKNNPGIFITEGGVNIDTIPSVYGSTMTDSQILSKQAELIQRTWNRHFTDWNEGAGVAMLSNYMMYTTNVYNSGLREKVVNGVEGAARPAYNTWKSLPSHR